MVYYSGNLTGFGSGDAGGKKIKLLTAITSASLTTNLKLCLDAGDENSYTSGQKWLDVSGGGYDFFLGTSASAATDDPTFVGTAGGMSDEEYFLFDGGDRFEYDTSAETWMQSMHKNGANWTALFIDYHSTTSGTSQLWSMASYNGGTNISGMAWLTNNTTSNTSSKHSLHTNADNSAPSDNAVNGTDDAVVHGQWNFRAVSLVDNGTSFFYLNGAYDQVGGSDTFTGANITGSTGLYHSFGLGRAGGPSDYLKDGSRMACVAIWTGGALSKANLDTIYTDVAERWGI